jgi:hypothetical protein
MRLPLLHPSARRLHDFALREEGSAAESRMQTHLSHCAECRADVRAIRDLVGDMAGLRQLPGPSPDALARLLVAREAGSRVVLASHDTNADRDRSVPARMIRVAAAIALIVLPAIGIAQAIKHFTRDHPTTGAVDVGGDRPQSVSIPGLIPRVVSPTDSGGQSSIPPTRALGKVAARGPEMRQVSEVRVLSDGRVLVNDAGARQIILLDSMLANPRVVLDTAGPVSKRYQAYGSLIPYLADTTLFVDRNGLAFVVLDPQGTVNRVVALPPGGRLTPPNSRIDRQGRLIYQVGGSTRVLDSVSLATGRLAGFMVSYRHLVRYDFKTHAVDTIFTIKMDSTPSDPPPGAARGSTGGGRGSSGGSASVPRPDPGPNQRLIFQTEDDWAMMADHTIAIARGRDYHIEWLTSDGQPTSSSKIAHEWRRITDEEKARLADSLTIARDSANRAYLAAARGGVPRYDSFGRITGSTTTTSRGGGVPTPPPAPRQESLVPIPPFAIPEYLPPFAEGMLADADNRLWIPRPETAVQPPDRAYDIVDRKGTLIDRVKITSGTIVGFGPRENVFVFVRDGGSGRLERARFR